MIVEVDRVSGPREGIRAPGAGLERRPEPKKWKIGARSSPSPSTCPSISRFRRQRNDFVLVLDETVALKWTHPYMRICPVSNQWLVDPDKLGWPSLPAAPPPLTSLVVVAARRCWWQRRRNYEAPEKTALPSLPEDAICQFFDSFAVVEALSDACTLFPRGPQQGSQTSVRSLTAGTSALPLTPPLFYSLAPSLPGYRVSLPLGG